MEPVLTIGELGDFKTESSPTMGDLTCMGYGQIPHVSPTPLLGG